MKRALALALTLVAFAGCGDDEGDDEPATTTPPPAEEPVASVPAPDEEMPKRCAVPKQATGAADLVADGVDCDEAESVLLNWLQGCGGQEGECEPVPGYTCVQERFAGSASAVECESGGRAVTFAFG